MYAFLRWGFLLSSNLTSPVNSWSEADSSGLLRKFFCIPRSTNEWNHGGKRSQLPCGIPSLCTGFWHEIFLFLPQTFTEFLSNRGERHENKGNKFVRKHLELIEPCHSQRHWEWMLWGNRFYFLDSAESIKEDQHPIYSFFIKPPRSPDGIWDAIWELSAQVLHLRSLQAGLCPHIKLQDSDWGQPGDAWEFGAAQSSSLGSSKTPKFYICH